MRAAGAAHFGRVSVVYAVVMRLAVIAEHALYFGVELVAVHIESLLRHFYSAERLKGAFERLVRLQTDDFFKLFIDISRAVGEQG